MKVYSKEFKKYLDEVFFIKPNDLGKDFLNVWFKKTTVYLKKMPFLIILPLTVIIALLFFFLFRRYLIDWVSFLQYGF